MTYQPLLAGFDVETTDLDPNDDRIIEIYVSLWRGGKRLLQFLQRIDPQRSISAKAQAVHKISHSELVGQPLFAAVAPKLELILNRADGYVAHNAEFDLGMLRAEFRRNGKVFPERPTLDTSEAPWATHDGKTPNLGELCFACGVDYDATVAHAADYDTDRMMECLYSGERLGFFDLARFAPTNTASIQMTSAA